MRSSDAPRKVVLPEGELHRFRLPEATDEAAAAPRKRRRRLWLWVLAWLLVTFVSFQWSEGRLGVRSWVESLSELWPAEPAKTEDEPARPRALPALSFEAKGDPREQAAIVAAPTATARTFELPIHQGSFEAVREAIEPSLELERQAQQAGVEVEQDGAGPEVHAGPGCERAKQRYKESFLDETEDPNLLRALRSKKLFQHCKAELMSLRLCALVHKGKAVGVTVSTEPPSRTVGTCAAIVAKTLVYPMNKRPQLVRTELYFD